jgi:hypothetical protein
MPWKGLRSNTAGGRKSTRHSFLEKRDSPSLDGQHGVESEDIITRSAEINEDRSSSRQLCHAASRDTTPPTPETPQLERVSENIPQQLKRENTATIPRSHRFSLLRFRHASDPQLSKSYATSTPSLTPPLPQPTSKCSVFCQPRFLRD